MRKLLLILLILAFPVFVKAGGIMIMGGGSGTAVIPDIPTFSSDFDEGTWNPPTTYGNWDGLIDSAEPANEMGTVHSAPNAMRGNANGEAVLKDLGGNKTEVWVDWWYYAVALNGTDDTGMISLYNAAYDKNISIQWVNADMKVQSAALLWEFATAQAETGTWYHIFLHVNFGTDLVQAVRTETTTRGESWDINTSGTAVAPDNIRYIFFGLTTSPGGTSDVIYDDFQIFVQATQPTQW